MRREHAEIDREEHAERDQRQLRGLEDAEPEDEDRHPGDRGDGAQRLDRRVEQPARRLLAPVSMPNSVPAAAPMPKPMATRVIVAATWVCKFARRGKRRPRYASRRDGGGISRPGASPLRDRDLPGNAKASGMTSAVTSRSSAAASPSPCGRGLGGGGRVRTRRRPLARPPPARGGGWLRLASCARGARERRIDQLAGHRHHVDIGRQHAGLLQRLAGLDDGLRLLRRRSRRWTRSLRSSCRATTASGSFIAATISAFSSAGCSTDQRRARS